MTTRKNERVKSSKQLQQYNHHQHQQQASCSNNNQHVDSSCNTTTTTTQQLPQSQQGYCLILDSQSTSVHSNQSLQMHFRCKKSYKDYTLEDVSQYFHLPIKEVSNVLGVSVTF